MKLLKTIELFIFLIGFLIYFQVTINFFTFLLTGSFHISKLLSFLIIAFITSLILWGRVKFFGYSTNLDYLWKTDVRMNIAPMILISFALVVSLWIILVERFNLDFFTYTEGVEDVFNPFTIYAFLQKNYIATLVWTTISVVTLALFANIFMKPELDFIINSKQPNHKRSNVQLRALIGSVVLPSLILIIPMFHLDTIITRLVETDTTMRFIALYIFGSSYLWIGIRFLLSGRPKHSSAIAMIISVLIVSILSAAVAYLT